MEKTPNPNEVQGKFLDKRFTYLIKYKMKIFLYFIYNHPQENNTKYYSNFPIISLRVHLLKVFLKVLQ